MNALNHYIQDMRPAIEEELQLILEQQFSNDCEELRTMMAYHMGWEGPGSGKDAQGKRIRPLLLLLCFEAAGSNWKLGLPAAAAVEYLHNFSLIHDDIEDNSTFRRGRETVWKKWGIAQAVNAGDFMFTLAQLALMRLQGSSSAEVILLATDTLLGAARQLTKGQYMDLTYESTHEIRVEEYWPMIGGKTSALLGCCAEIGAILAGANSSSCESFRNYGYTLGLAFQVQDDWLGIWGDSALTGKSNESDLVAGKKSLPILYGLSLKGKFSKRWLSGPIALEDVNEVAKLLTEEGVKEYTEGKSMELTEKAIGYLNSAAVKSEALVALHELADLLINRQH